MAGNHERVGLLPDAYLAVPEGDPVRLAKRTSNRSRSHATTASPHGCPRRHHRERHAGRAAHATAAVRAAAQRLPRIDVLVKNV